MRGFQKYSCLPILQQVFECLVAASPVRVENIPVGLVALLYRLADLSVIVCSTANILAYRFVGLAVQVQNAGEIAGVSHIHRVGKSRNRRARRVNSGIEVLQENIVAVVGGNESFDRQSHTFSEQTGCYVAEIPARYANNHVLVLSASLQLRIGIKIVE